MSSCATFMQSMMNELVSLCNLSDMVQLCNYSKNFFLMLSFIQNISQCNREKTYLYELPHRHVFYIKLFICSFLYRISFRSNVCFQWNFIVVYMFIWIISFLLTKLEINEINKTSQLKIPLLLLLACYCKIDFIFRSLANGNYTYSSMSLLLVGNNSSVKELRFLTSVELYLHSELYGKLCCFESVELSPRDTKKLIKSFFI